MRKLLFLVVVVIILSGCQPQSVDVWGQGEPPGDWQEFFGNENMARLNWVQTQSINNQGQAIAELAERVRKIEERFPSVEAVYQLGSDEPMYLLDSNDPYEVEMKRRGIVQ